MSDTSRTDAEVAQNDTRPTGCVPSNFARTLERENNQLRASLNKLTDTHGKLLVALDYNRIERDHFREALEGCVRTLKEIKLDEVSFRVSDMVIMTLSHPAVQEILNKKH